MATEYIVTVERPDPGHGPSEPATQVFHAGRFETREHAERYGTLLRRQMGTQSTRTVWITEVPAV